MPPKKPGGWQGNKGGGSAGGGGGNQLRRGGEGQRQQGGFSTSQGSGYRAQGPVQQRGGGGGGFRTGEGRGGGAAHQGVGRAFRNLDIVKMGPSEDGSQFKGSVGTHKNVVTNYFPMKFPQGMQLNRYRVDYYVQLPEGQRKEITTKNRMAHRERFWKFVQGNAGFFNNFSNVIYDDAHEMYTLLPLNLNAGETHELTMDMVVRQGENAITIVMVIKAKREGPIQIGFTEDGFKVLNLILNQFARCPIGALDAKVHCEISRLYIKPDSTYHKPLDLDGFNMLRGLYSFAKRGLTIGAGAGGKGKGKAAATAGQAYANFDVTHSAFYKVQLEILQFYAFVKEGKFLSAQALGPLRDYGMNQHQRNELRTLLSGLKVKKMKFADDVVESEAAFCDVSALNSDTYRFHTEQYGEVSVREYYLKRYGYNIRFPKMPLIQIHPRERSLFLPIEILQVSDRLQRLRRKLPDVLQALTNQFTTTEPKMRFSDIDQMVKEECKLAEDPFLNNFNVEITPSFLEIGARILPTPNCEFSRSFAELMRLKAVEQPQFLGTPKQVIFDLVIVDGCIKFETMRTTGWANLVESCRARWGGQNPPNDPIGVTPFSTRDCKTLDALLVNRKAMWDSVIKRDPNMMPILIIATPDNNSVYKSFKGMLEIPERFGFRSQVIRRKTWFKLENESGRGPFGSAVARNIFLKINGKCGGVNCKINRQQSAQWASKFANPQSPTLFIGIDVTHPAPGDTLSPSISALVGNVDLDATRFTATVRAQNHRTEWIENMAEMFNERLTHFQMETEKINKQKVPPGKIIVFRDGVADSQFEGVLDIEYTAMKKTIDARYKDGPKPKLTFLVVQKRHNTRFFDRNDTDPKNKGNLQPGTVIDGYITSYLKEFYLCSHKGMLGTSKPAHYFVLKDENGFTADDLHMCSNNLCYLFARAPMPVSIPAPVYYAHLACFRARHHYAAADDDLPMGPNGEALQKVGRGSDRIIREPTAAVQVAQKLRPTMYFI